MPTFRVVREETGFLRTEWLVNADTADEAAEMVDDYKPLNEEFEQHELMLFAVSELEQS